MATGVVKPGTVRPQTGPTDPEPANVAYLLVNIINHQRAGLYVTRPASLTIGFTNADDADLTELYATLRVQIQDHGAPEAGLVRADVSLTTTYKCLLSPTTGLPNDEDCEAEIAECGVETIAKVDLRQPDAVLLKSRFLRAVEPEPESSVVTSQQLSAGAARRPSWRQTRQAEESSAATPPFKRTAYADGGSHPQKYKTLTEVGIHRLQILCIIWCYSPLLRHACFLLQQ